MVLHACFSVPSTVCAATAIIVVADLVLDVVFVDAGSAGAAAVVNVAAASTPALPPPPRQLPPIKPGPTTTRATVGCLPKNMSEWSSLHPSPKCAAWTTTHKAGLQRCYQLEGNHHTFRHGQRHLILLEVQHHPRLTANEAVVNPHVCGAVHTAHGIFSSPHAVPRSPPAIGAPSVGRPRRGSSYISTGVLRVPSVASPFTAHTAECTGSQRPALRSCCPHPRRSHPLCRPLSGQGPTRTSCRP